MPGMIRHDGDDPWMVVPYRLGLPKEAGEAPAGKARVPA
jgi:hypothetical protein